MFKKVAKHLKGAMQLTQLNYNSTMHFEENYTYHIYNRSNQTVFKTRENYLFFLRKVRGYILPYSDILAWCLMPNHFHFMLSPNKEAIVYVGDKHMPNTQILSKQIGTLLSSYTKAFNKQNNRKGSLFAHNTKAKQLNEFIVAKHTGCAPSKVLCNLTNQNIP